MTNNPLPPSTPPLIGPHEGRELELMLAGKKKLALFTDAAEAFDRKPWFIPEEAFAPHVAAGRIIRHVYEYESPFVRSGRVRVLGYTLPGEEWRFMAVVFFREDSRENKHLYTRTEADDIFIGRLLGYKPSEVRAFLEHKRSLRSRNEKS